MCGEGLNAIWSLEPSPVDLLSPADPQTCRGKGVVFKPINLDWFVMQQVIFLTKEAFTLVLCDMFYFTSFQFLKILIKTH